MSHHGHGGADNPFDRKVAMTMAILAAGLAFMTMLSHRTHTETLRLETAANIKHTKAADTWAFFQAKNIRKHEYESFLLLLGASGSRSTAKNGGADQPMTGQESPPEGDEPGLSAPEEHHKGEGEAAPPAGKEEGKKAKGPPKLSPGASPTAWAEAAQGYWEGELKRYDEELEKLKGEAEELGHEADEDQEHSHHQHEMATWFDSGELGMELALVLCSVAVLTKARSFWLTGIVFGALGMAVGLFGFLAPHLPWHLV